MATEANKLTPLEQCKQHILSKNNFVLQGGAGSGKTETLKELLLFIKQTTPNARVVCITHTNVAVDEIESRVGEGFVISTIHSFLNNLIKDYKKNMKYIITNIFTLKEMNRMEKPEDLSDTEYKKLEHELYKKIYKKYATKLYDIKEESVHKVTGKRDYDKNPEKYNEEINVRIRNLNAEIETHVNECEYTNIKYNETVFNSYKDVTFGHNGLLEVFHLLFEKYPILRKMIKDNYDFIFIDEYQDSNSDVVNDLISIADKTKLTIALFGDSMQAIYGDGIGDITSLINDKTIMGVEKPDNYRCSYEVLKLVNPLRLDGIVQEVAFKRLTDGKIETEEDRHGEAIVLYSICKTKPTAFSSVEDKQEYQTCINELLEHSKTIVESPKILMLTNKSISQKNNFEHLYKIFDDRFIDVSDRIENYLKLLQVLDLCELCYLYKKTNYNPLIKKIQNGGFVIKKGEDKKKLKDHIKHLQEFGDLSIFQALEYAKTHKLLKESETFKRTVARNKEFLKDLDANEQYQLFKKLYNEGKNTFARIIDYMELKSEEEFDNLEYQYKKERFVNAIFSSNIKFSQAIHYYDYLNEETNYITMHKTKGSSIPSIIVVMEEFFWNEYDFSLIYSPQGVQKAKKQANSQKLIYVACSRARNSVVCFKILKEEEINDFKKAFPNATCFKDYSKEI
ncbi:MAG: ATP-dependent helicase [Firmicutes bacterium HGW-Firmicutes-7]|nr:MAG: ATP-dependent helicase [Firmicutes bacterium HGW-Firmicutes-7]